MARKQTVYSVGFESEPTKHAKLLKLGRFVSEEQAMIALGQVLKWREVHLAQPFQTTSEILSFAAYPSAEEAEEALPPFAGAPRIHQHNVDVVDDA